MGDMNVVMIVLLVVLVAIKLGRCMHNESIFVKSRR